MDSLSKLQSMELESLCLGALIGSGYSRDVYHFPLIPNTVIKIERDGYDKRSFQNTTEWLLSEELKYTDDIKYIAKSLFISHSGRILIQEYAEDVSIRDMDVLMNTPIPNFITDLKLENIGKTKDGRIVIRDYGFALLTKNYKLEKVKVLLNKIEEIEYE